MIKKKRPLFTIVTATRNRYKYLKSLYKSLSLQSYKNIEWIIGNDGSIDKTDKVIKLFIKENKIKIKYIKSDIRIGKSKIDNLLLPHASGKYLCYCGSDDYFKKNAFKNMNKLLNEISNKNLSKINAIVTQSINESGESQTFYNNKIPKNNLIMTWEDYTNYVKGDSTMLERTKAYKNKKFKEVDFLISESTLINKIHKKKLILISPIVTKIMRRATDSISFGNTLSYCRGYAHSIAINFNKKEFHKLTLFKKLWFFINYWRYVWHGDIKLNKAKKMWVITKNLNIYYLLIPLSVIMCIRDKVWKKIKKTHLEFNKNKNIAKIRYIKL